MASQAFGLKNLEQEGKHSFMAALLHLQIADALGTEKARKIGRRGIGGGQTSPYLTGVWPLSPRYWLVSKARRVGQTPKADFFVWFMSVLMGISEEPPHSIVHWCGISILPTPSILSSKGLVHPTAPCYWGALILWAALLCEISAKELKVSHLLDGMLNSLETHSPFPVGAGAGHSPIAAPFLHPCVSLQFLSLSWCSGGRLASLMPGIWDAHLFLPCGRHIQALQMIIWGVPLFEVREGKAIPVLRLEEWQCHLTTSHNAILPLWKFKTSYVNCHRPLPYLSSLVWHQGHGWKFYSLLGSPRGSCLVPLCLLLRSRVLWAFYFHIGVLVTILGQHAIISVPISVSLAKLWSLKDRCLIIFLNVSQPLA